MFVTKIILPSNFQIRNPKSEINRSLSYFYSKKISPLPSILENPIDYLKGVGPLKADLLKKELGIFTFGDLLEHFPLRHMDRPTVSRISDITPDIDFIQVAGV